MHPLVGPGAAAETVWDEDRQRLNIGIKLFPACLAADQALASKLDDKGHLVILVLHTDAPALAAAVAEELRSLEKVQDLPLAIRVITPDQLAAFDGQRIAALFVAAPGVPSELFERVVRGHRALLFSPFAGDVERGAVAGIELSDRILPYINLRQAEAAQIRFKPFFLRVAAHYE